MGMREQVYDGSDMTLVAHRIGLIPFFGPWQRRCLSLLLMLGASVFVWLSERGDSSRNQGRRNRRTLVSAGALIDVTDIFGY